MFRKHTTVLGLVSLLLGLPCVAQSPSEQLQKGIYAQETTKVNRSGSFVPGPPFDPRVLWGPDSFTDATSKLSLLSTLCPQATPHASAEMAELRIARHIDLASLPV